MTPLKIFNTLTRKLEIIVPKSDNNILTLYTCGPTVYSYAHIGNFRTFVVEDLFKCYLKRQYSVRHIMNITDVDDKTIHGAYTANISLKDYTDFFKNAFHQDCETLLLDKADNYPNATDSKQINRMIQMIETLIKKEYAYVDNGSVYFRIHKFPEYGKLASISLDSLQPKQILEDEYNKESVGDFSLWKAWSEKDLDVFWESPWGKGRPGWHIECSAIATDAFGPTIDIHCGGIDNIFPHHECEIAQCESIFNTTFVRYWLHISHLLVNGEKMSKSAGNFLTIPQLLDQGWAGREIRYLLLSSHYRTHLNFTSDGLIAARSSLNRLNDWIERLQETIELNISTHHSVDNFDYTKESHLFWVALDNDLNISEALGILFQIVRFTNKQMDQKLLSSEDCNYLLQWYHEINSLLKTHPKNYWKQDQLDAKIIPDSVMNLLEKRKIAREQKNWLESDRIRSLIAELGYSVQDNAREQKVRKHII